MTNVRVLGRDPKGDLTFSLVYQFAFLPDEGDTIVLHETVEGVKSGYYTVLERIWTASRDASEGYVVPAEVVLTVSFVGS